jgi:glycosyltransferase involved in cell wall biosynthesis
MLLSIIIPVYNEELTVGNIIDRTRVAVQQTGFSYEIIVVDDRSYDKSLEVARQRHIRVFTLKQHLGKGYALRAGFAQVKGDIVVTIDSVLAARAPPRAWRSTLRSNTSAWERSIHDDQSRRGGGCLWNELGDLDRRTSYSSSVAAELTARPS